MRSKLVVHGSENCALEAPAAGRSPAFMEALMANPVPPNAPSKNPGQPSGGGRGNNPPKGK
jgi:hypothetical protein